MQMEKGKVNLAAIKLILESTTIIDTDVFLKIVDNIPAGLLTKLRLVPDSKLSSKLAHLYEVSRFECNEVDLGFEYVVISTEGINDYTFFIDHDVIVKNVKTGKVIIIDCTANPALIKSKQMIMNKRIIDQGIITEGRVHVFIPKVFTIAVSRPTELSSSNSSIFDLLDTISNRSHEWRDKFFESCSSVYNDVCESVLLQEREELNERYNTWELSSVAILQARQLLQEHTEGDAKLFKGLNAVMPTHVYYDTFAKILSQQRSITAPFYHKSATLNTSNILIDVLGSLRLNPIAAALNLAMRNTDLWVGIDSELRECVNVIFIESSRSTKLLPVGHKYKVIAKHRKGHSFVIKFREDVIDDNFREQICRQAKIAKIVDTLPLDPVEAYDELCTRLEGISDELREFKQKSISNSILGKIASLGQAYNDESCHAVQKGASAVMLISNYLNSTCLGELVNHDYEVAKCFAASLKVSPRLDEYYVGVNGPFNSVTITRMTSTQDSFATSSYFTIYDCSVASKMASVRSIFSENGSIVQSKTRTFNKNSLSHALKMPFMLISLITWEVENNSTELSTIGLSALSRISVNSALHLSVNSDQFAQAAEQLRYLFTSNTGLGASAEDICKKIDFIRPRTLWEIIYLFRMLKLGAALNVIFKTKNLGTIMDGGNFNILFPNSIELVPSFSYVISSMYYANIYNKFRAFHEVSEAICYNELIDEDLIYRECKREQADFVQGITEESKALLMGSEDIDHELLVNKEVEFCRRLVQTGPGRFKMSLMFIIGATLANVEMTPEVLASIYKSIGTSPIDACTMHGAMERGASVSSRQGIRAASVILEELAEEMGEDVAALNKDYINGTLFIERARASNFDFSILSAVSRQFNFNGHYQYRIVQKDQKGHREISVLNAKFRMGALLCERIAHQTSMLVKCDVLDDPNKDIHVETAVRDSLKDYSVNLLISDNSDQKRWGPNHLLHSFAAMYLALFKDDLGLFRILNLVLHYGECKLAKFPENLIDLGERTKYVSRSEPIKEFFDRCGPEMKNKRFARVFEWGMCQGIFHRTSSLYHGIMCQIVAHVAKMMLPDSNITIKSYVTSDDAERIISITERLDNRVSFCKKVHSVINNVGCVMNILRNESKSVFSAHLTEFNSIFYHKGVLATPTLKQRISKIDIGDGHDHIQDYLTVSSLAMGYFQNGGSYVGTIIMTILNLCLHTEQWNRWRFVSKNTFSNQVEFGGFPAVDPFSVLYSGPISTLYFRWKDILTTEEYANIIAQSILLPASEVQLSDFKRTESAMLSSDEVTVFKSAGPIGIISMSRTDRKLSQFEKRHSLSKWNISDDYATLNSNEPSAIGFLFNLCKITKTAEFEHSLGVNSFYIRFTDPWVNFERKCYKMHEGSYINKHIYKISGGERVSPMEIETKFTSVTDDEVRSFVKMLKIECMYTKPSTDVPVRLSFLLDDAMLIYRKVESIEDPFFIKPCNKNSIVRVNLTSRGALDEDVFLFSLLKSVIGDKIRDAIIKSSGNRDIWEKIPVFNGLPSLPPAAGVYFCNNIIQAYSKFIRHSIKIICPGDCKPVDIPDLIGKILSCKFTERYGIPAPKFEPLKYATVPGRTYMVKNYELQKISNAAWELKEANIDVDREFIPKLKYVTSDSDIITAFDDFNIEEMPSVKKTVLISSTGKLMFMQKIHLWSSIDVAIKFSERTKQMFIGNEFTNYHEYCLDNNTFIKNQTGIKYSVTVNDAKAFEIQTARIVGTRTIYDHVFFSDNTTFFIKVKSELVQEGNDTGWHYRINEFLNDFKGFRSNVLYRINDKEGNLSDTVKFVNVTNSDTYEIRTYSNNLTLFLEHMKSGCLIPICSQNISDIAQANLGFKYTAEQFQEAMIIFAPIYVQLYNMNAFSDAMKSFIRFFMFRTSATTPVSVINEFIQKRSLGFSLSCLETADILRCLILSNITSEVSSSQVRVKHYFLNLFRTSPSYNNGITSITFREAPEPVRDQGSGSILEEGIEAEEFDLNIPDGPAWMEQDMKYDDVFSQGAKLPPLSHEDRGACLIMEQMFNIDDVLDYGEPDAVEREIPAQIDAPMPVEVEPVFEGRKESRGTHIINRHFEECNGLIKLLTDASNKLIPTGRAMFIFSFMKSLHETFQAIAARTCRDPSETAEVVRQLFPDGHPLYTFGLPLSAPCLIELYFK